MSPISSRKIVIDGLRDVDGPQFVTFPAGVFVDDPHGIGGIVAADVEEIADVVFPEYLKNPLAICRVRFVAGGTQRRRRGLGNPFEIVGSRLGQIDEGFGDDAAHPVARAPDPGHFREPPRFQHRADQALIDHRRRTATLGDHDLAR